MTFCAPLFGAGAGTPAAVLSIMPMEQSASAFSSSWGFAACTVTVSAGTPSSIVWSFENVGVGSWSVASGQGTLTASALVQDAIPGELSDADFVCRVTISGVDYVISSRLQFFNIS
jgi:hypothetical protein